MSDSLQPYWPWPARFLCPWDSPGKNTGVGCHFPLQGIFLTQGSNLISCISCIDRWVLYHRHHLGSPEIRHNFWNLELFLKKRCLLILFVCLLILKANIGQQKINTAFWQNYVTKGMKSFPGGSVIKICLPMQEIQITWEIPWTEEPGRQQSTGLQKSQTWLSNQTTNGQK